jgi:ABC-type Mn2+/Zn2+ transport system permease subunit
MVLTALFAALAGTLGLYAAYYATIAPAAVVVVALGALFGVSLVIAPRGPLRRDVRQRGGPRGPPSAG